MAAPDELIGATIDGRYRVLRQLGKGGMGYVYEGLHVALDRKVAIKVLHPRLAHEGKFRERFIREARSASKIRHPNVVQILDFGETAGGLAYFAMELLDGRDLRSIVRQDGPIRWPLARQILWQATSALAAAHGRGIIHRDIKPANCVLCTPDDRGGGHVVKLLDFGIAKIVVDEEEDDSLTGTGEVFGTATYMAPEQAHGRPLDARSDVYSLGIMAYEMLVGRPPFTGANPIHIITRHISEAPKPLRAHDPSIPPAVEALVLRAIAKHPDQRFESMAAFGDAVAAIPADPTGTAAAAHESYADTTPAAIPPAGQTEIVSLPVVSTTPAGSASLPPAPRPSAEVVTTPASGVYPSGPSQGVVAPDRTRPPPDEPDVVTAPASGVRPQQPDGAVASNSTRPPPDEPDIATTPFSAPATSHSTGSLMLGHSSEPHQIDTSPGSWVAERPGRTRALPLALGGALVLGIVGAGAWAMWGDESEPSSVAAAGIGERPDGEVPEGTEEPQPGESDVAETPAAEAPLDVPPSEPSSDASGVAQDEPAGESPATSSSDPPAEEPEATPAKTPGTTPTEPKPEPRKTDKPKAHATNPPKAKTKTDASVRSQLVRKIKKKCRGGNEGSTVTVEATVGSSGSILAKIVKGPAEAKACAGQQVGSVQFPEGSVRQIKFSVDL